MINQHKAGLVLGSFLGLWHVVWSALVAFHLAQPFMDWIFWLHMMDTPMHVQPFSIRQAAMLIIVTTFIGYIAGYVLVSLSNYFHKNN